MERGNREPKSRNHPGYVFHGHTGEIIPEEDYLKICEQPESDVFTVPNKIMALVIDRNRTK